MKVAIALICLIGLSAVCAREIMINEFEGTPGMDDTTEPSASTERPSTTTTPSTPTTASTETPSSSGASSQSSSSGASTQESTTAKPVTEVSTTSEAPTEVSTTAKPVTEASTTSEAPTEASTTTKPVTEASTTSEAPTEASTPTPTQDTTTITPTPTTSTIATTPQSTQYVTVTVTATVTSSVPADKPEKDYVDVSKTITFQPVSQYIRETGKEFTYYDVEDEEGNYGTFLFTTSLQMYPGESTVIPLQTEYLALYTGYQQHHFYPKTIERYEQFTANINVVDYNNKKECRYDEDCDNYGEACTPDEHNDGRFHCRPEISCEYNDDCPVNMHCGYTHFHYRCVKY